MSRVKSKFTSEDVALQSVCKSNNLQPEQLTPAHTEKMYSWTLTENATEKTNTFSVKKDKDFNLQAATQNAMQHLETSEANLNIDDQEKEVIYTKKR